MYRISRHGFGRRTNVGSLCGLVGWCWVQASDIDPVPPAAVGSTTGSTNVRIEDVRDSSRPLWCMFKLAVAGGMMTAFEAWTFEITTMYVVRPAHTPTLFPMQILIRRIPAKATHIHAARTVP